MSLLFAFATLAASRTIGFDGATASSTSSVGNVIGSPLHNPDNALASGSAHWESSGGHASGETVTFTGTLASAATIDGVKVAWVHAPAEIRVLTSSDGSSVEEAAGWRRTGKDGDAFAETIAFGKSMRASSVTLAMRSKAGAPIAISQVAMTSSAADPVMFVSGLTSTEEMCMVTENGLSSQDGAVVTLEGCAAAIAAGDGREIFSLAGDQIKSVGGKCVIIGGGSTDFGGSVELGPCDTTADGRAQWAVSEGASIRSAHGFCLAMAGARPSIDASSEAKATASSSADGTSPDNVKDGSAATSWESATEGSASIAFEFPDERRVSAVSIEWTKAARNFDVQYSNDGAWVSFAKTNGNSLTTTTSRGPTGLAKRLRVLMHGDGPFGIRSVQISTAPSRLIAQDCDEAALLGDARGAFFAQHVPEFSAKESASLRSVAPLYTAALEELSASVANLVDASEKCGKRSFLKKSTREKNETALFSLTHAEDAGSSSSSNEAKVIDDVHACGMESYSKAVSQARSVLGAFEK